MTEEQRKKILVETVNRFGKQEWFRNATVYDSHPETGEPTLELKVNYLPLLQRKDIKEFALTMGNLADRFVIVDRNGNPRD